MDFRMDNTSWTTRPLIGFSILSVRWWRLVNTCHILLAWYDTRKDKTWKWSQATLWSNRRDLSFLYFLAMARIWFQLRSDVSFRPGRKTEQRAALTVWPLSSILIDFNSVRWWWNGSSFILQVFKVTSQYFSYFVVRIRSEERLDVMNWSSRYLTVHE